MNRNIRFTRHRELTDASSRMSAADPYRSSTVDSGRGSMTTSERTSTLDSAMSNGTSSSLSRDTPLDVDNEDAQERSEEHEPIHISRTTVIGNKCYDQAYVSHIDHPSAFFLQLAHFHTKFQELHKEINEYYSKTPITNAKPSWKRGDYCIVKFTDNQFYRARIVEVPEVTMMPGLYDVVYVDYGNWNKVAFTDIRPLLRKFTKLTAQAIPCSLTHSLPRSGTWSNHPKAMQLFKELVSEKYVDATFYLKTSRDPWPLSFVDLVLSSNKVNVRQRLTDECLIRDVPNEDIYVEFHYLLRPADYIIYSIPHEDDDNGDDNDD